MHRLRLARTKQTSCKSMFFAARAPPSQRRAGARQGVVSASCDPRSPTQCLRCRYTSLADSLFSVFSLWQGRDGRASAVARARRSCEKQKGQRVRCGRPQRELRPLFMVFFLTILTFCSIRLSKLRWRDCLLAKKMQERRWGWRQAPRSLRATPYAFPGQECAKTGTRTTRTVSLLRGVDGRRLRGGLTPAPPRPPRFVRGEGLALTFSDICGHRRMCCSLRYWIC